MAGEADPYVDSASFLRLRGRASRWARALERLTYVFDTRVETVMFDYGAPADLVMQKRKGGARQPLGSRRFTTAADAICFVVEKFPAMRTLGAWMQVGDERFDIDEIQRLYESSDYPLPRRASD